MPNLKHLKMKIYKNFPFFFPKEKFEGDPEKLEQAFGQRKGKTNFSYVGSEENIWFKLEN